MTTWTNFSGSSRYSRTILAALATQCTKATFFMLGEMAAEYPGLVKEIAGLGHTIGPAGEHPGGHCASVIGDQAHLRRVVRDVGHPPHQAVPIGPVTLIIKQNAAELSVETRRAQKHKPTVSTETL